MTVVRNAISASEASYSLLLRLWREHVRNYRGRLLIILVLTALMAGTTALYPVVIDHAFSMFTGRDQRILYQVPLLVLVVTSVKAAAQYFQNVMVQQVVLLSIRDLQGRMFGHLVRADLTRLEREAPAQLAARFTTDAATIREALTRAVNGLADSITVIGLVASMLYLDWVLSVIAAALYPLAALPIQRIGKRIRRASGGMQERMGETAALLNESFAQARTVRAYGLENSESVRAEGAFGELYNALYRMTRSRARVDPLLEVLGGAAVAAVIGFAGWRAAVGTNTIGNFTGFVAALLIASRPLRALGSLNAAVQEGLAGLSRIFTVLDEKPLILDAPNAVPLPPGRGHVVFDNVGFVYPDGRAGLSGLSFEAAGGDLHPGDEMAEFGKLDQHLAGIGAGVMQARGQIERRSDLAPHRAFEEVDDLAAIGKAEHGAYVADAHAVAGTMGDALIEQRQRVAHRALGDARDERERVRLGDDAFGVADLLQVPHHQRGIDALEIEADAARAHGDRHLVDLGGREQEFHVLRRLFERLQQAVEGRLREHVDFVDDVDLGARRDRAIARVLDDLAHVVDAGVRGGVHLDDVDMARFDDRLAMLAQLRHVDARLVDLAGDGIVERPRQNARRRGLADPAHAGEDIGLMDAFGREGIGEGAHHRLLPDEVVEARGTIFAREDAIGGGGGHLRLGRSGGGSRRLDKDPPWLVRAASFRT